MTTTIVTAGQTTQGAVLGDGDEEILEAGGAAIGTVVNAGGTLLLYGGGIASGTSVNSGGLLLRAGGLADDTVVHGGGNVEDTERYPLVGTLAGLDSESSTVISSQTVASGGGAITVTTTTRGGTITGERFGSAVATSAPQVLPAPVDGTATVDLSSLDIAPLLRGSGVFLQPGTGILAISLFGAQLGTVLGGSGLFFQPGTEAVQLLDGVLSIGPDTNEAFLARLYAGLFGRMPDAGGIGAADDLLSSGQGRAQVAADFLASPEGTARFAALSDSQLVTTLFQGFLGRAPSTSELGAYAGVLAAGATRGAVTAGIAGSAEAAANLAGATAAVYVAQPDASLVERSYVTAFGREPDLAGARSAIAELQGGGLTPLQLAQQISTTPEFLADHAGQTDSAYVASLYQAGLGRAPSAAELGADVGGLQSGAFGRALVLLQVAGSAEAAAHLTRTL